MSDLVTIKRSELEEVQQFFEDVKGALEEKDLKILELQERVEEMEKQLEPQPLGIDLSNVNLKSILSGSEEANNFIR